MIATMVKGWSTKQVRTMPWKSQTCTNKAYSLHSLQPTNTSAPPLCSDTLVATPNQKPLKVCLHQPIQPPTPHPHPQAHSPGPVH
jgi:hypothetical protein